ncbi:ATP-binding protein [Nocardioides pacificus]
MAPRLDEAPGRSISRDSRTVARTVAPMVATLAVLVFLLSLIGVAGLVLQERTVRELTDELQPATLANVRVLQALTDAETGVRAWSLSGQQAAVEPYLNARERLPDLQADLRDFAEGDAAMTELVRAQEEAGDAWLRDYAEVRLSRPGGTASYDAELFAVGKSRFDEVREAHDGLTRGLEGRVEDARQRTTDRRRTVGGVLVLVGFLSGALAWRWGRRTTARVSDPLVELHSVVERLRAGEETARAQVTGPREVRSVAQAINDMAAAQQHSRAIEKQVLDELRRLDSAKGDFVSNVSHELRTPLFTISGYVDLAAEEFEERLAPRHLKMLHAVQRNVKRLQMLIDDLLALSKAESHGTDLQQVDLVELLHDVVGDLRMTAARRDVHVDLTGADDAAWVLADRGQLSRVFVNLISNAVKFSHDGGHVTVSLDRAGDDVVVVVADEGIGIPSGDIDQLGTRFYRASNAVSSQVPGTGLGLRIVQTIVDNHAGVLHLESVEGEGTTVSVRLPGQAQGMGAQS